MKKIEDENSKQSEQQTNSPNPIQSKTVTCYYCDGTGSVITGMPCPNCKGKGLIVISTKGL